MTPAHLALIRAERHFIERLEKLEPRLDGDPACWAEYATIAQALAAIAPQLKPEVLAEVLSQEELGERFGISTRTVRRRVKARIFSSKRKPR